MTPNRIITKHGKVIYDPSYAQFKRDARKTSQYITARHEASRRSREIREKSGPASMEWMQSALFLYACKKHHLDNDVRKAIWAYTSALIVKLEDLMTSADKLVKAEKVDDAYHWVALQLRSAIRSHMKLLEMFKGEDIVVPQVTEEGRDIRNVTHRPKDKDANEAMNYAIGEFRMKNPNANPILPKKDL